MLPLDTSNRVHYGYMAVLESIHTLLNGQMSTLFLWAIFIMGGIQIWATSLLKKSQPGDTKFGKWLKRNADRLPRSLKSLFASFGISGLIVVFLYYLAHRWGRADVREGQARQQSSTSWTCARSTTSVRPCRTKLMCLRQRSSK